jgi:Fe-S-cluster containining protein
MYSADHALLAWKRPSRAWSEITMNLYFSFPDGVLDYDCARCTALCCRGQGISAHADHELVPLLRRNPALASWATGRSGNIVHFATPAGRCFFLGADDRCDVERDLGHAQKPSLCRAFPFNRVSLVGDTTIVSPHLLCPLLLNDEPRPQAAGNHARLTDELQATRWLDQRMPTLDLPEHESAESWLAAELTLRDDCAQAFRDGSLSEICSTRGHAESAFMAGVSQLLAAGEPEHEPHADQRTLERCLLALAPTWSMDHSARPLTMRRRVLLLARFLISRAVHVSGTRVSLQVCNAFMNQHDALLGLLCMGDQPMPTGLLGDTGHGASMLASAITDRLARHGASVFEALAAGCEGLSALDRHAFLNSVAEQHRARLKAAAASAARS